MTREERESILAEYHDITRKYYCAHDLHTHKALDDIASDLIIFVKKNIPELLKMVESSECNASHLSWTLKQLNLCGDCEFQKHEMYLSGTIMFTCGKFDRILEKTEIGSGKIEIIKVHCCSECINSKIFEAGDEGLLEERDLSARQAAKYKSRAEKQKQS
jgi:hypothetical protein